MVKEVFDLDSYNYNQTLVTSNVDTSFSSVMTRSSSREELTTKLETISRIQSFPCRPTMMAYNTFQCSLAPPLWNPFRRPWCIYLAKFFCGSSLPYMVCLYIWLTGRKRIQNLVKHLKISFFVVKHLKISFFAKLVNNWKALIFFTKKVRVSRLKGFWIRLSSMKSKLQVLLYIAIWNNMYFLPC